MLDLVRTVEHAAIRVRNDPPSVDLGLEIDEPGVTVELPFERPLYSVRPEASVGTASSRRKRPMMPNSMPS